MGHPIFNTGFVLKLPGDLYLGSKYQRSLKSRVWCIKRYMDVAVWSQREWVDFPVRRRNPYCVSLTTYFANPFPSLRQLGEDDSDQHRRHPIKLPRVFQSNMEARKFRSSYEA